MKADCGCWTDDEGFWQLGDQCREAELQSWRDMMNRWEASTPTTAHDRAVDYFWQELGKTKDTNDVG